MVSSVTNVSPSPDSRVDSPSLTCPRCTAQLRINYDEPVCLQCGYVDYQYTPPSPAKRLTNLISAGTSYVVRYVGEFPSLADTLAYVYLKRLRNRAVYGVACPFCSRQMEQSSLSGKRREVREERYKCPEGHRLSLMPGKNGSLGWK